MNRLEQRCARLARTLDARENDEVVLLRAARILKKVHADLRIALWASTREVGRTPEIGLAEATLTAIERDLRRVLLDYPALPERYIRQRLSAALNQAFDTLELLRAPSRMVAEAGSDAPRCTDRAI
jgi:hypothetical protein